MSDRRLDVTSPPQTILATDEHAGNLPARGTDNDPLPSIFERVRAWFLRQPWIRNGIATLSFLCIVASIVTGIQSTDPWALLAAAIICLFLLSPKAIADHIESVAFPGGGSVKTRRPMPDSTKGDHRELDALAKEAAAQQLPLRSSAGKRELCDIEPSRELLGKLRTAGVGIRNEGMRLSPGVDLSAWYTQIIEWRNATKDAIALISPADSEMFVTLDVVEPPRIPINPINAEHAHYYRMLDMWLKKLERLATKYEAWGGPVRRTETPQQH